MKKDYGKEEKKKNKCIFGEHKIHIRYVWYIYFLYISIMRIEKNNNGKKKQNKRKGKTFSDKRVY